MSDTPHLNPNPGETPQDYRERRLEILATYGISEGFRAVLDIIEGRERELIASLYDCHADELDTLQARLQEIRDLCVTLHSAVTKKDRDANREALGGMPRRVARQAALARDYDKWVAGRGSRP